MTRDSATEAAYKQKMAVLQKEKEALEVNIARLRKEKFALANQLHHQDLALHASLSGWLVWKADGSAVEMSLPWKKVLGHTFEEEPTYEGLMHLLQPADRFGLKRINSELIKGLASRRQKLIYLQISGSNRLPVLIKATALPDENGQPEAIAYYFSVLEQDAGLEQALSGFDFNQLALPIIRVRWNNGEPVFLNQRAWKVVVKHLGEAEIQHISELIGSNAWLTLQEKIKEGDAEMELSLEGENDFLLYARLSGPMLTVILVDISTLRESLSELQQMNMQLDNFVYHASHDLRAPLRTVLGLLDILKSENNREERERCVSLMEGTAKRLDSLVVDLLSISRNRLASDSLVKINFMVEIEQAVSSFYQLGETKNMEIRTLVKQTKPFFADLARVRMVLNNVISNAIKYRRYNVNPSFIEIRIQVDQQAAHIEVEDNGEGIPADMVDQIFNMFFRASENNDGAGLGLYIVSDVLKKLEGNIQVESTYGKGSKFSITIPNRYSLT